VPWQVGWHGEVSVWFVYADLFVVGLEAGFHYSADAVFEEVSIMLICCCGWVIPSLPGCQPTCWQVFQHDWESTRDDSLSKASQESSSLHIWVSRYSLGEL
jgi:hypothetical protein